MRERGIDMKRTIYKGYVIDRDEDGRLYTLNTKRENADRVYLDVDTLKAAKEWISAEVWKHAPRHCYTICYGLRNDDDPEDFFTATWFAYGRDKTEAKENFLKDFNRHPEDFYGATADTKITICNVVEGFSC